jgi:hypothetical protein
MFWSTCLRCGLVFLLLSLPAKSQLGVPLGHCGPLPHELSWPQNQIPSGAGSTEKQKLAPLDMSKLQHQAQELADLSSSIPADIHRVNSGVLSKELLDKLRRVEKLSKQLRGELTR